MALCAAPHAFGFQSLEAPMPQNPPQLRQVATNELASVMNLRNQALLLRPASVRPAAEPVNAKPAPAAASGAAAAPSPAMPDVVNELELSDSAPASNQDLALTAHISRSAGGAAPSGTVTFVDMDYNHVLGSATVERGEASIHINSSKFPNGGYSVVAIFDADGAEPSVTSLPARFNVAN